MTYKQLQEITEILKDIPDRERRDKAVQLMLQSAADTITCDVVNELIGKRNNGKKTSSAKIKFTKKEIESMSKTFKREFIANGMAAHIIERPSGKHGSFYEIRYRRNGYDIAVSNKDLKTAKAMFIEATHNLPPPESLSKNKFSFGSIADEWLKYKHGKVAEDTWKGYESQMRRFIPQKFKDKAIKSIRTSEIDELMNALDTPRKYEDMRIIFNSIFKYAKASGIVTYNPVEMIPFKRAERENRDRLTDGQIKTFLTNLQTPIFDKIRNFALAMYFFGLRPCEIDDEAHFENGFLICRNRKRKNGKKAYKKIPVPRQAEKFFNFNLPLKSPLSYDRTLDIMKKALPEGVIPYQLRHTFASVCDETVKREVVELWMGDSPERLVGKTYVHYSDEFMRNEMDKVNFVVV
jgi:integrase